MNLSIFNTGSLVLPNQTTAVSEIQWNQHPSFAGVFLKHLLTAKDTTGLASYHLVRIDPGCEIGLHTHTGKMEVHEVVSGSGYCQMSEHSVLYTPGMTVLIPADMEHQVVAGNTGLELLAKFFPALL